MEESISSSRTTAGAAFFYGDKADCYGHSAAASEDSGWTAYFDDDYQLMLASESEPAPAPRENKLHRHLHHGDCNSASTVSSANATNKKVKMKKATEEKKKRPRSESEPEDPLQDTASSPPNATQLQLQDAWQIAECEEGETISAAATRFRRLQWDHWMGQVQKRGPGLLSPPS